METIPSAFDTFIKLIYNPRILLGGCVEYVSAWLFTRRWLVLISFLPALLLLTTAVCLVGYGAWIGEDTLLERYSELADEELGEGGLAAVGAQPEDEQEDDASSSSGEQSGSANPPQDANQQRSPADQEEQAEQGRPSNQLLEEEEVSQYAELLLRRVLQLQDSNARASYLVAARLGQQGREAQARQMMRRIAPAGAKGFAPAHAWLAVERLRRNQAVTDREDLKTLLDDLEAALSWRGTGPALKAVYADLLEQQGNVNEAINILGAQADESPDLQMKLANLAYRHNRRKPLERIAARIKQETDAKIASDEATADDYAKLSNIYLLEGETQKAREFAGRGLQLEPDDAALKRLISEAFRVDYARSVKAEADGKTKINLGLLDAALKADPSNPAVTQEVARLVALGKRAPPDMRKALETQLASGQATALTRIILANRKIQDGDLRAAVPHLELALRQAPNSPNVLNNLALALARLHPDDNDQLKRAGELIDKAVMYAPGNAEYRDTQGEIRGLLGDRLGAIESYEAALSIDQARLLTRQQLADMYQAAGMADMAQVQRQEIRKLQREQASSEGS